MTILSLSWSSPAAFPNCSYMNLSRMETKYPKNSIEMIKAAQIGGISSSLGRSFTSASLGNGGITDIFHNKVLIAAALSAAIGQLSKPFTSALFRGHDFDIREAFQAGGFPSSHSSTAVAAATCIGLERGFSDAVFGLAVVYAALVMYDAQGVRREVGVHGKVLNQVLLETCLNQSSSNGGVLLTDHLEAKSASNVQILETCLPKDPSSLEPSMKDHYLFVTSGAENESKPFKDHKLKESVGHSVIEVIAGALLGFLVSLAVFMI
ncbi:unnamed protein product [Cuscuta campestris]|uniref:Uncharacterized protein n=1 Tax=Cuscuta campestris TaxID=132261 RepID=A0A484K7A0_9ASTE|nr:unnamed protein product [Cuscuta campestris]